MALDFFTASAFLSWILPGFEKKDFSGALALAMSFSHAPDQAKQMLPSQQKQDWTFLYRIEPLFE